MAKAFIKGDRISKKNVQLALRALLSLPGQYYTHAIIILNFHLYWRYEIATGSGPFGGS